MKYIVLANILFLNILQVIAQPSTEIYVFDLSKDGEVYSLSNPINISKNKGYDNQPHFLPDGTGILYASNRSNQTDVYRYDFESGESVQLTDSEGSEFSPTVDPSGRYFSTIILEKNGTQLLWKYTIYGGRPELLIPASKVGYHCWLDEYTIVSFVLGDPATLEVFNTRTSKSNVLAKNIGRSLHKIPNSTLVSYVDKSPDEWMIKSIDPISGETKDIVQTLKKAEDMAWASDGTIFMGKDARLYQFNAKNNSQWVEIASLEKTKFRNITRVSVAPDNSKIAIVVDK